MQGKINDQILGAIRGIPVARRGLPSDSDSVGVHLVCRSLCAGS